MFIMRVIGCVLIVTIVVFAIILYRGATNIEKMIIDEEKQAGDK